MLGNIKGYHCLIIFFTFSVDDEVESFFRINKGFANALTQDLGKFIQVRSFDEQVDSEKLLYYLSMSIHQKT